MTHSLGRIVLHHPEHDLALISFEHEPTSDRYDGSGLLAIAEVNELLLQLCGRCGRVVTIRNFVGTNRSLVTWTRRFLRSTGLVHLVPDRWGPGKG